MKKSILRFTGAALAAVLAMGMMACSDDDEPGERIIYGPECVLVPGGTVTGSGTEGAFTDGTETTIKSFYMSKYEITQELYKTIMAGKTYVTPSGDTREFDAEPSECNGTDEAHGIDLGKDHSNYPVDNVSWYDAVYFCNFLSRKDGYKPCYNIEIVNNETEVTLTSNGNGYRLPTEAEWEYAARGGDPSASEWNYAFSGSDKTSDNTYYDSGMDSVGWYGFNNKTGTSTEENNLFEDGWQDYNFVAIPAGHGSHEVGKKAPNSLGLYDMSGNADEWCYDASNKWGGGRIIRGGSWGTYAVGTTVYAWDVQKEDTAQDVRGFRIVRTAN